VAEDTNSRKQVLLLQIVPDPIKTARKSRNGYCHRTTTSPAAVDIAMRDLVAARHYETFAHVNVV
jgi:hypothetical protein